MIAGLMLTILGVIVVGLIFIIVNVIEETPIPVGTIVLWKQEMHSQVREGRIVKISYLTKDSWGQPIGPYLHGYDIASKNITTDPFEETNFIPWRLVRRKPVA
jgi:hypothetical protein